MTQRSYFWDGTVTGDAGPFTPNDHNHFVWSRLFALYRDPEVAGGPLIGATQGIIEGIGSELVVQGTVGGIVVGTGAAIVDGTLYQNTSSLTLPVTTPASQTVYSVTLRKNTATQEIRVTFIEGADLRAQLNILWDLVIAKFSIDTDGTIVVADNRRFARSPLIPAAGIQLIETQTLADDSTSIVFNDIPQTYRHLDIISQPRLNSVSVQISIQINGNTNSIYSTQNLRGEGAVVSAAAQSEISGIHPAATDFTEVLSVYRIKFNNYRKNTVKTYGGSYMQDDNVIAFSGLANTTDPITSIQFGIFDFGTGVPGDYKTGSTFSLYGII